MLASTLLPRRENLRGNLRGHGSSVETSGGMEVILKTVKCPQLARVCNGCTLLATCARVSNGALRVYTLGPFRVGSASHAQCESLPNMCFHGQATGRIGGKATRSGPSGTRQGSSNHCPGTHGWIHAQHMRDKDLTQTYFRTNPSCHGHRSRSKMSNKHTSTGFGFSSTSTGIGVNQKRRKPSHRQ